MSETKTGEVVDIETWFEVESSLRGDDDWYSTGVRTDTKKAAVEQIGCAASVLVEFRVIRKTVTTTVEEIE